MDPRQKLGISIYAILYGAVSLVGFRLSELVPVVTIYFLITGLFIILIALAIRTDIPDTLASVLLLSLVCLLGLLVVDPLEIGFYGYDPYATLRALNQFQSHGLLWLANKRGAWPSFYAFTWTVTSLLEIEPTTVGKYIPMVAAIIPIACFVAGRRLADSRTAFLASIGVVGIRTLVGFEMKFVDETVATTLFFVIVAILAIQGNISKSSRLFTPIVSLFAITAVLTHHYVGLLVTILLCIWAVSHSTLIDRFIPSTEIPGRPDPSTKTAAVVASVAFVVVLLVVANSFVFSVLGTVDIDASSDGIGDSVESGAEVPTTSVQTTDQSDTLESKSAPPTTEKTDQSGTSESEQGPPTTEKTNDGGRSETTTTRPSGSRQSDAGGGADGGGFQRFIRLLLANIVILGLIGLVAASYFREHSYDRPTIALSAFTSILVGLYGWSVAFGRIIPLDPSRYLLFMASLILIICAIRLARIDSKVLAHAFSILIVALVVTQLVLLPPVVWYSDQSETIVGEDHYSPSQFAASDWVSEYDGDRIIGWERGVWVYNGIYMTSKIDQTTSCETLHVWRSDTNYPRPTESVLYDAGSVALYTCSR